MTTKLKGFDFDDLLLETERREGEERPVEQECVDCGRVSVPHHTFDDGSVWCLNCWFANTG